MATLVVLSEGKETVYELKAGQNLIGRRPDCPIPIIHPTTSGRHAVIHAEGGHFILEDSGSRNGTFVNQQRIAGRVKLNHNDAIRFGDTDARFLDPARARRRRADGQRQPFLICQGQAERGFRASAH